ncbi:trypsin-like peptidase domain-containing protein [Streptomyces griseocarneus]|uniref:trypsin-like peptidase domain-containing protein n=1 Tax=Streptomyces griseocarneus TaxID=51201 RepID=UPI001CCC1546|nr:trypsin-like peptidase domain-containing protein [Streptomyces griseocarneus]MBZ6478057.1 serine protease [Streptomyces griseocarneus]
MNGRRTDAEVSLVRIRDLAGRARGTGFLADDRGTLITSHEAVDGLARLVLHAHGELTCVVSSDDVTPLPEYDLALVRTEGLSVPPLPVAAAERVEGGTDVRLRAGRWHNARIIGDVPVTYTATDRFHLLGAALELSLSERAGLRLGEEATGGPVFDAAGGAVIAVLGTALQADRRAAGFAIPLRAAAAADPEGPLAQLLHRNDASVPAFGPDLNLAGALQLTATALGSVVTPRVWRDPVERPETERAFARFLDVEETDPGGRAYVLGLVGDPGTGRTTELGALAWRRARGAEPAPTLWLRGADLCVGDESVRDALERALAAAGRIVTASAGAAGTVGDTSAATPEAVAELARRVGRPLLVLLDGPEEMPPVLAHALPAWTAATAKWLEANAARLIVACRPEHWESAGALFPPHALHGPCGLPSAPGPRALPPCSRLPALTPGQAAEARASYGIPPEAIDPADAGHPLALRLLAEVRAALPDGTEGAGGDGEAAPDRWGVFAAHLDLVCLRIAVRLAAARRPPLRGAAVRRLAARVAGQVHEAARRCLGPGQGELEREAFEELFPWRTGWASAVLTEGLLVPAGSGYRFAHEEFADWLQGTHLDLDAALHALVHRWYEPEGPPAEAAVRLPSRAGGGPMPVPGGHVPPPPGSAGAARAGASRRRKRGAPAEPPRPLPVPRHRIGPVLQAMLLLARRSGPTELSRRLSALVHAVETLSQRTAEAEAKEEGAGRPLGDPSWWAAHLLGETLLRVPDATPYLGVLRLLAERVTARSVAVGGFDGEAAPELGGLAEFGPWFWRRVPLGLADRLELLRILLPADGPPPGAAAAEEAPDALDGGAEDAALPAGAGRAAVPDRAAVGGASDEAGAVDSGAAGSGADGDAGGWVDVEWDLDGGVGAGAAGLVGERHDAVSDTAADRGEGTPGAPAGAVRPGRPEPAEEDAAARVLGADADDLDDGETRADGEGEAGTAARVPGQARHEDDPSRAGDSGDSAGSARSREPVVGRVPGRRRGAGKPRSGATRAAAGPTGPGRQPEAGQAPGPGTSRGGPLPHVPGQTRGATTARTPAPAGTEEAPGPVAPPQADRFLTAVATLLADHPCAAQPLLCRWFTDERPLQTAPDAARVRPTVATAAQALLHTHRRRAIDDLAEALVQAGHPRADELLAALAEDEPSALCRAVDRWAHDERVERHVAAAAYGLRTAPHVTTDADRELLRFSALALLARPAEGALHGTALALLVRDPGTRARHLPQALGRFAAGDPHLPPEVLAPALTTHSEPVLAAFRARLYEPGDRPAAVLRTLSEVSAPALARRVADLVREHVEHRPEGAENAAAFVDRRLEDGPAARSVLFPLVVDLLRTRPAQVRRALAPVLADPGTPVSRPLRQELLEVLMEREEYGPYEQDVTVLDALLRAVAAGAAERTEARTRDLVHRTGLLMARTPEGAACFDRRLTQLAREVPVFGDQVRGWLKSAPAQWAVVVGPSARIRLTAGREKGGGRGQGGASDPTHPADVTGTAPADAGRRQPAWHS